MTQCKRQKLVLSRLARRRVEADFSGGRLSSNAGLLLVREIDRQLGLLDVAHQAIPDPRNPAAITHQQRELLAQRVFALAAGYQDGNDHQALRCDPALQLAAGRELIWLFLRLTSLVNCTQSNSLCRLDFLAGCLTHH
jgi:Transposase DDE domain group 1